MKYFTVIVALLALLAITTACSTTETCDKACQKERRDRHTEIGGRFR